MLIPIGTDVRPRRPPIGNWVLIALNVLIFFVTDVLIAWPGFKSYFTLNASVPSLSQYITYQFLHGDLAHLAGNMLFLWIFGNAVCDRLGNLPYVLFYLAGGVFAGVVFAQFNDNPILGASGAIAAVTTAFLVLYPRVHITMLLWMFIVTTFQLPAMLLIVIKIILWDNVFAPALDRSSGMVSNVAYSAHLAGYAFGFLVPMLLLAVRALPRNQFDLLAVFKRWRQRGGLAADVWSPPAARPVRMEERGSRPIEPLRLSPVEQLREEIVDRISEHDLTEAVQLYRQLLKLDAAHVLPRRQQLELANHLAQQRDYSEAAHAYEAFLAAYPSAADQAQVRLMLGLIYGRYLHAYQRAAGHLAAALEELSLDSQRELARQELAQVQAHISGPAAEPPR